MTGPNAGVLEMYCTKQKPYNHSKRECEAAAQTELRKLPLNTANFLPFQSDVFVYIHPKNDKN